MLDDGRPELAPGDARTRKVTVTIDTAVDGGRIARLAGRARRMPTPVAVTVMAVVGAAVHLLRDPTAIVAAGFWAEDGTIYFADAVERGWGTLLEPYGSQLFLFPRAVAALVAPLPVVVQPVVYAIVAIAVAVASCSIILSSRWGGGGAPRRLRDERARSRSAAARRSARYWAA
jgi:hypothetical protein